MNNALHDTLSVTKRLKGAGMNEPQAEAVAKAIHGSMRDATAHLATKEDLSTMESRLTWRVFGMMLGIAGLLVAVLRLVPV